ncbi:MAG: hypothetical protein AB7I19_13945 [Planctomycetota bacterium]
MQIQLGNFLLITLGSAVAWSGVLPAQEPEVAPPAPETLVVESQHRESRSLALFAACDRNADDRLDVFEFGNAFVDLEDRRGSLVFRSSDADASGFLEWSEFDERMRVTIERNGRVRLRPLREVAEIRDPTIPPPAIDPTEQIIEQFDIDQDGGLSADEFRSVLRRAQLDMRIANRFAELDADADGALRAPEFGPILLYASQIWQRIAPHEKDIRRMPAAYRATDLNLDGAIDLRELELGLSRIQPSLARWANRVLYDADRSRDKMLGAAELNTAGEHARERLRK